MRHRERLRYWRRSETQRGLSRLLHLSIHRIWRICICNNIYICNEIEKINHDLYQRPSTREPSKLMNHPANPSEDLPRLESRSSGMGLMRNLSCESYFANPRNPFSRNSSL